MAGRHREKPIDPFIQMLMDVSNCKTLSEASELSGISIPQLASYSNRGCYDYRKMGRLAAAFKVDIQVVIDWILVQWESAKSEDQLTEIAS